MEPNCAELNGRTTSSTASTLSSWTTLSTTTSSRQSLERCTLLLTSSNNARVCILIQPHARVVQAVQTMFGFQHYYRQIIRYERRPQDSPFSKVSMSSRSAVHPAYAPKLGTSALASHQSQPELLSPIKIHICRTKKCDQTFDLQSHLNVHLINEHDFEVCKICKGSWSRSYIKRHESKVIQLWKKRMTMLLEKLMRIPGDCVLFAWSRWDEVVPPNAWNVVLKRLTEETNASTSERGQDNTTALQAWSTTNEKSAGGVTMNALSVKIHLVSGAIQQYWAPRNEVRTTITDFLKQGKTTVARLLSHDIAVVNSDLSIWSNGMFVSV